MCGIMTGNYKAMLDFVARKKMKGLAVKVELVSGSWFAYTTGYTTGGVEDGVA